MILEKRYSYIFFTTCGWWTQNLVAWVREGMPDKAAMALPRRSLLVFYDVGKKNLPSYSNEEMWGTFSSRFQSQSQSHSVVSNSLWPCGLSSPWNFPGQNTGVGSLSLLQGIFPIQELNPDLPHCRQILYQLSHQGISKPKINKTGNKLIFQNYILLAKKKKKIVSAPSLYISG